MTETLKSEIGKRKEDKGNHGLTRINKNHKNNIYVHLRAFAVI